MAAETIATAYQQALNAGFAGQAAVTIVAIAMAESGLNPSATNTQGNSAGVDRGILQINSYYHSEVTNEQAFDPQSAFVQAYRISNHGTDFRQWATYTTSNPLVSYKRYLSQVQNAVNTSGLPQQLSTQNLASLFGWMARITNPSQSYNPPTEWGNDLPVTCDTHVFSPYAGTLAGMQRYPDGMWGCVVSVRLAENVGPYVNPSFYVLHLDAINPQLVVNQVVQIGTFLGWTGGENDTSQIPGGNDAPYHTIVGTRWSTGPHVECGFNCPNLPAMTANGPSFDPHEYLLNRYQQLIGGTLHVAGDTTPGGTTTMTTLLQDYTPFMSSVTGSDMTFAELCNRIDYAMEFTIEPPSVNPLDAWGHFTDQIGAIAVRGVWGSVGILLIALALFVLIIRPTAKVATQVAPVALDIGALL